MCIRDILLQYLRTQKFQGARARQEGGTTARIRARPHMGAVQNVGQVWEKLWKDVFAGRTLVCSADHPALGDQGPGKPGVYSVPSNAVAKLNADRTVSVDIRVVTDLRDIVLIPGIGHWVQQEAPHETNRALLDFLDHL